MAIARNLHILNMSSEITTEAQMIDTQAGPMFNPGHNSMRIKIEFAADTMEDGRDLMNAMGVGYVATVTQDEIERMEKYERDREFMHREALANVHATGLSIIAENEVLLKSMDELQKKNHGLRRDLQQCRDALRRNGIVKQI